MRLALQHAPTLREAPREADSASHRLLVRAGFIRRVGAGLYALLPLGVRALGRLEALTRAELDAAGAQELSLPPIQPLQPVQPPPGVDATPEPEQLLARDRRGQLLQVGPPAEALLVALAAADIRSYRQLPLNLYAIQPHVRDQPRPRGGLLSSRHATRAEGCCFDLDAEAAARSYETMVAACARLLRRCGLDALAASGPGDASAGPPETTFHVLCDSGEDTVIRCVGCEQASTAERAAIAAPDAAPEPPAGQPAPEAVPTPDRRTVEEVTTFLGVSAAALIKTMVVQVDGAPWLALVRGDRELSLPKLQAALGADEVALADDETVRRLTGAPVGFAGPSGLRVRTIADPEVMALPSAVTGGNAADLHLRGVVPGRDFRPSRVADLRLASDGDPCAGCGGRLSSHTSVQVAAVYPTSAQATGQPGCTCLDGEGAERPMIVGRYVVDLTRALAAVVERHHDERGICWPASTAPFSVVVLPMGRPGEPTWEVAERLYLELRSAGVAAAFDDRDARPGAKFADAELSGHPLQLVVGKRGLAQGGVELRSRRGGDSKDAEIVGIDDVVRAVVRRLEKSLAGESA